MRFVPLSRLLPYLVPLLVLGVVMLLFSKMQAHRTLADSDYARKQGEPLPVRVYPADVGPLSQSIPADCLTMPNPLIRIGSKLPQRVIARTHVRVGQMVRPGTLLATLDDEPERLAIARAEKLVATSRQLVLANQQLLTYFREVRDQGLGQERELRLAEVDLRRSEVDLARAEADLSTNLEQLGSARIDAHASGVVLEAAQPGEISLATGELVRLAVIDPLLVECQLPEDKWSLLRQGQTVRVSFSSRPGETYDGPLKRLDASSKDEDHLIKISLELANPERQLLPGLHGLGELRNEQLGLRVPSVALINPRPEVAQVFVVDADGSAHLRPIALGVSSAGYVQVLNGLSAGDRVVVAGQLGLREGDRVRVEHEQEATESP